jgi:alpha-D-ribose 1-methylphosphonate 5-triphosphate diphosphatase
MTDLFIEGGHALLGGEIRETSLAIASGEIIAVDPDQSRASIGLDARGLKVLPGIVDLHGDAFERQMMPRPGVDFPIDVALVDSDRQAISNGITTVYHATTWSWEPGLRSGDNARQLLEAIETLRPQLAADTRFHLRQETYNLDAESAIAQWLSDGRIICSPSTTTWNPSLQAPPGRGSARRWWSAAASPTRNSIPWCSE